MESPHFIPLHHGLHNSVGGALQQQALVPIGVQWVGEVLGATMVRRTGTGPTTDWGCHCLNPLQDEKKDE